MRVIPNAPKEMRPRELCSICGIRELDGNNLYLVEFPEGEAIEIPEQELELIEDVDI